jgi:hypothetical protein
MAYRNSGGFSTSGRPTTDGADATLITPSPMASTSPMVVITEVGQPSSVDGESGKVTDSPVDDQINVLLDAAQTIESIHPANIQAVNNVPRQQGERLHLEHLTFFNGSNDVTGLSEDLDWLFDANS